MLSLVELQRRIDSGDLSPDAAIALSLEAIGTHEKTIGAFVCHAENARAQNAGPLRGIAVGIKDIIDTANFPTEMGSPIYRGFRPRADAPVVAALRQAGATIIGKTTTTVLLRPTIRPRRSIRTITATRRAGRRPARRQPLEPAWSRWRWGRRPAAR